jgi:hypothetical protein
MAVKCANLCEKQLLQVSGYYNFRKGLYLDMQKIQFKIVRKSIGRVFMKSWRLLSYWLENDTDHCTGLTRWIEKRLSWNLHSIWLAHGGQSQVQASSLKNGLLKIHAVWTKLVCKSFGKEDGYSLFRQLSPSTSLLIRRTLFKKVAAVDCLDWDGPIC